MEGVVKEQEGASLTRMVSHISQVHCYYHHCWQLLISTTVLLPGLAAGSTICFPAVALPHFLKPGTDIVMTDGQASWFGEKLLSLVFSTILNRKGLEMPFHPILRGVGEGMGER